MATTHTVQQGETLQLIAKKYRIGDWKQLYYHADNAEFRKKRPNPNILNPGDVINIPDFAAQRAGVSTGAGHTFVVRRGKQILKLRLVDPAGKPLAKVKAKFNVAGQLRELLSNTDGAFELEIAQPELEEIPVEIFALPGKEEPSHRFVLRPGHLDPADTVTGVQSRLNSLGYDCGKVDGVYGQKTKAGIQAFQRNKDMAVDGQPSSAVCSAVAQEYGC